MLWDWTEISTFRWAGRYIWKTFAKEHLDVLPVLLEKYSVDRWSQRCLKVVSSSSEKRAGGTSWGFAASGSGQLTFIDRKMTSQVYQVILQQDLSSTGTQKLSGSTGQWSKSRTKSTIKYPIWYDPVLTSTWLACFGKTSREWFTPDIPQILLNWNDCVKRKHFFPTLPWLFTWCAQ